MADIVEDSGPVGRRWNPVVVTVALLLLAPVAPLLLPSVLFAGVFALSLVSSGGPTASTRIPDFDTDLTLRFYYTWGDNDFGRYLDVNTPSGRIRVAIAAHDWSHYARTSVYLTPERQIAVLGPTGADYLVSLNPLKKTHIAAVASENWTYLGAFDYELAENGRRTLRFISAAEQAECIPMLMEGPYRDERARMSARKKYCSELNQTPSK